MTDNEKASHYRRWIADTEREIAVLSASPRSSPDLLSDLRRQLVRYRRRLAELIR